MIDLLFFREKYKKHFGFFSEHIDVKEKNNDENQLRISYAPDFSKKNPYQRQLATKLEELGCELEGINYKKIFLPTAFKKKHPNILHLHWLQMYFNAASEIGSFRRLLKFIGGLIILNLKGIKIVWTAHNLNDHEGLHPLSDKLCSLLVSRLANAVIVHSNAAKAELCQRFHIKRTDKVFVIPHGNYIEYYENNTNQAKSRKCLGIPESSTVFLFFGMIRWYKGLPELIDAFEKLQSNEAYLLIAGKFRNEDSDLEKLIRQKIEGNKKIKLVPDFIAEEEVQIYMNACDATLFPYKDSLTSGALILAMSFHRACVAPDIGCMKEILTTRGGFLYNPEDSDGLVQALKSVIQEKDKLAEIGEYNYNSAKGWSWETVAQMTFDVYKSL